MFTFLVSILWLCIKYILAGPDNLKGLFEGQELVLRAGLELGLH